jgi:hypothetical protein
MNSIAVDKEVSKGRASVREQFVERAEGWIEAIASDLPEDVLAAAMKDIEDPSSAGADSLAHEGLEQMQTAIMLRAMRALRQAVQGMSNKTLLSAIAASSDYGALARAMTDPHAADLSREVDPFAGAVARSIKVRQQLAEMAGEMLTSTQVADHLGVKRQAVDKQRKQGKLLAVQRASDWHYPAFQFESDVVSAGVKKVLSAYEGHDPWFILDTLLAPDDTLDNRSLLEAIRDEDHAAVDRNILQDQGDGYA